MGQEHVFKSGLYTNEKGEQVYGVNPADVEAYAKSNPDVTSIVGGNSSIVSGSQGIRQDEAGIKSDANKLLYSIDDLDALYNAQIKNLLGANLYSETEPGKQYSSDLDTLRKNLGITSEAEETQIEQAGQGAYGQYRPLIQEAEEAKRIGMPKAIIGAGERGGFMSTQMAGGAALQPTEGGTFVGEGGELNRIKSVYDQNISNLKVQAENARLAAQAAARAAIRTGKREDYDLAQQAFNDAQTRSQNLISLANEKMTAISNYLGQKKTSAADEVSKATTQLNYYLDTFGADYLEKNKDQIKALFMKAGYADTDLDTVLKVMKEKEAAAIADNLPKPELRTVGNSLYSVTYNKDTGLYETKLLISKPTGGGTTSTDDKEEAKFRAEVADLITELDNGEIDWRTAFDSLKTKYPDLDDSVINGMLGGSIPYNPTTGQWDVAGATGRAVAGYRQLKAGENIK